jgi:hypothetical protein
MGRGRGGRRRKEGQTLKAREFGRIDSNILTKEAARHHGPSCHSGTLREEDRPCFAAFLHLLFRKEERGKGRRERSTHYHQRAMPVRCTRTTVKLRDEFLHIQSQ